MECRSSPALSPSMYLWRLWRKTRLAAHLSHLSVATTSSFLPFNSIPFYLYNTKTTVISRCLPFPFLFFVFISPYLHQLSPHCGGKKNNNYFKELQHLTCDTTSPKRAGTVHEIWIKAEYNALHISWSHILFTNIENISNVKTDKMENLKKHK